MRPVSGSVITLEQGKLSVMVGGREESFERVKPLLLDLGPKVTHVGENGLGAGDEDRHQLEPRGTDAGVFRSACCWPRRAGSSARPRWTC